MVASLSACAGKPVPPQGELWFHYVSEDKKVDKVLCSDLQTGSACPAIDISQTAGFYLLEHQTFRDLQNYIDALIRYYEGGSSGPLAIASSDAGSKILLHERDEMLTVLYAIRDKLKKANRHFRRSKSVQSHDERRSS